MDVDEHGILGGTEIARIDEELSHDRQFLALPDDTSIIPYVAQIFCRAQHEHDVAVVRGVLNPYEHGTGDGYWHSKECPYCAFEFSRKAILAALKGDEYGY